jgi:hypothetical protein
MACQQFLLWYQEEYHHVFHFVYYKSEDCKYVLLDSMVVDISI